MNPTWDRLSDRQADQACWDLARNWKGAGAMATVHRGVDVAELLSFVVGPMVARAVRTLRHPARAREELQVYRRYFRRPRQDAPAAARSSVVARVFDRGRRTALAAAGRARWGFTLAGRSNRPTILIPRAAQRQDALYTRLARNDWLLVVDEVTGARHRGDLAYGLSCERVARGLSRRDRSFIEAMQREVPAALARLGAPLDEHDVETLCFEIRRAVAGIGRAIQLLDLVDPDAVLVHDDRMSPMMAFVQVARARGIPTILLQHGLDCEPYRFDEAYADQVAVWGKARGDRYRAESSRCPARVEVVGNPDYDAPRVLADATERDGGWLWATKARSSTPLASDSPFEGLEILQALLAALEDHPGTRLTIKPHPRDFAFLYPEAIDRSGQAANVRIATCSLGELLPAAGVVITEDSTAGMDAMLFDKMLVHVDFGPSGPFVPFADHGAALPSWSPEGLAVALGRARSGGPSLRKSIREGQRRFLEANAGMRDGRALERVERFVANVLSGSAKAKSGPVRCVAT
jgi:hypothetical protein